MIKENELIYLIFFLFILTTLNLPAVFLIPIQVVIFIFLIWWRQKKKNIYIQTYRIVNLYILWAIICSIRGFIIAENYTEYRQLVVGTMNLMLPLIVWFTYDPQIVSRIFRFWLKYIFMFSIVLLCIGYKISAFISPLLIFSIFSFAFNKKNKRNIILWCLFYLVYNFFIGDRTPVAKMASMLMFSIFAYSYFSNSFKLIKFVQVICYGLSIALFTFIMFDVIKVFYYKESEDAILNNYKTQEKIEDTRSLLYIDVIKSAIDEKYILFGHTPARGNKLYVSPILFIYGYKDGLNSKDFNKNERFDNEASHLNIFTWTGLLGFILYSFIYFRASYLALYKSKNKYIKIVGCIVALYWTLGFIETTNKIDLINLILWTTIGMCYSNKFRNMNNQEFYGWCNTLVTSSNNNKV